MTNETEVKIKRLSDDAIIPTYGSTFSAGADLYAINETITIQPNQTKIVNTGISLEIPEGYVGLICARSGLATKQDLAPANKVGVIDSDYRGEILVALHNHGEEARILHKGDRIAQLVITPYLKANFKLSDDLRNTSRGDGGFGSTGK